MHELIISPPASRYAALHRIELQQQGCRAIGPRLWTSLSPAAAHDATTSAHDVLQPFLRSATLGGLLQSLRQGEASSSMDDDPWSLRFEDHGKSGESAPGRAHECLSAVARYLKGPSHLLPGIHRDDVRDLVLLRSRRLWYLAESPRWRRDRMERDAAQRAVWGSRPYSFSAATDPTLAQLALSIALRAHEEHRPHDATPPKVLDPCCGSGTVLFAAASRGLPACGCDLNPLAAKGSRDNLEHAAAALKWGGDVMPAVAEFDCTSGPLPAALTHAQDVSDIGIVLASLPWGRQQRLSHAFHIRDILSALRAQLRAGTTFCCLSAVSIAPTLQECGLRVELEAEVGGRAKAGGAAARCVLSISRLVEATVEAHTDGPNNDGGSRAGTSYTSYRAQQQASSGGGASEGEDDDEEEQLPPLELLTGGGLKGGGGDTLDLRGGAVVAVQCRSSVGGRVWVRARVADVEPAVAVGGGSRGYEIGGWDCQLSYEPDEDAVDLRRLERLPRQIRLARFGGPNWRLEADS